MEMEIMRGDIFYVETSRIGSYGTEINSSRPAIIVSNNKGNFYSPVVEVVYLTTQDKKPLPTHVDVVCRVKSTALCEQIHTVDKNRLGDYIRTLRDDEMENIDKALSISLGLSIDPKPVEIMREPSADVTKLETERDMYKNMYEHLLEKLFNK